MPLLLQKLVETYTLKMFELSAKKVCKTRGTQNVSSGFSAPGYVQKIDDNKVCPPQRKWQADT